MSGMMTPHVISIQVGLPRSLGVDDAIDRMDRPWSTGFFKEPVQGELWLGITNLAGDGQADLKHHGGEEKAVLAYAATHYPWWQEQLNLPDLCGGAFGENLTITQQTEQDVCIGDIYEFGAAQIQVSQPRQPCWKLSRRWRVQDLALQVQRSGKTGWYFRVLRAGYVTADRPIILGERPYPQWTIARANQIMHQDLTVSVASRSENRDATILLAECPALATNWRRTLLNRATKGVNPDSRPRLWGDL